MASQNSETARSIQSLIGLRTILLESSSPPSLPAAQVQTLSPIALAYIGDAVYELFVRGHFLMPPGRIQAYHQKVVGQVRAEQQSQQLFKITPYLTLAEQDILRKGRNAAPRGPRRIDPQTYQQATSFETLIGYLYLTDPQRLQELLALIELTPSEENSNL